MRTDVITVSTTGARMEEALRETEKMADYKGLSQKNKLHLVLLTEEMMSMMRSITGETKGEFWIEDEDGVYSLHLEVETRMNSEKRERLLSASTSGKNESAKGLMGRLRDLFDRSADEDVADLSSPLLLPEMYESISHTALEWEWSMTGYQAALAARDRQNDEKAQEAWDELEKSVVAHVADDVKVYIKGMTVEMVIIKKMN